jgi:MoaA/NifB/PqqE/SkfB family radical SAM enzyme
MRRRLDHLAHLGTLVVTLTGGEAMLHPELPAIVAHARRLGMTAAMNTNGYLLSRARVEALNAAGLFAMQVSVDNVRPTAVSKKSLAPLLPKLRVLAAHARFRVRVNTVLGVGDPAEALEVARTALRLGFDAKCSLVRNPDGTLAPIDAATRRVYDTIKRLGKRSALPLSEDFQDTLLRDGAIEWRCRAGARFFTVCEDGLVHLCTPRWGQGARPLAAYGVDDIRRAFDAPKPCAVTCPVTYAHQGSALDRLRGQDGPAISIAAVTFPGAGRTHLRVVAA